MKTVHGIEAGPESYPTLRRPSKDPDILNQQLLRELERLRSGTPLPEDEQQLYRAYLFQAEALAWEGVARGELDAPRQVLDRLLDTQTFAEAYLRDDLDPREKAAYDVHALTRSLYLADRVLSDVRVEVRLKDRDRSALEREICRVLYAERESYLHRGDIHRRLRLTNTPTPSRVGQILRSFSDEGLLKRTTGPAQGNPRTTFYALSPKGLALCRRLGLDRRERLLFNFGRASWEPYLRAEHLLLKPSSFLREVSRIVTFYSYRGGVGRSSLLAQACGQIVSKAHRGRSGRILVADLDLEAPGLDPYFAPEGTGQCRGLCGLIHDYLQISENQRSAWLRENLENSDYVLRPSRGEKAELYFLPTGLVPGIGDESTAEAAGAMERLRHETVAWAATSDWSTNVVPGFLTDFRAALRKRFELTLCDARAGLGFASFLATQVLADQIVVCVPSSHADIEGTRMVLGNYLRRNAGTQISPSVIFVVTTTPDSDFTPDAWIESTILKDEREGATPGASYAVVEVCRADLPAGRSRENQHYGLRAASALRSAKPQTPSERLAELLSPSREREVGPRPSLDPMLRSPELGRVAIKKLLFLMPKVLGLENVPLEHRRILLGSLASCKDPTVRELFAKVVGVASEASHFDHKFYKILEPACETVDFLHDPPLEIASAPPAHITSSRIGGSHAKRRRGRTA